MTPAELLLQRVFAEAYRQISQRLDVPKINAQFYPFAGLNSTIRLRNQQIHVRVSDILITAPPVIHTALAHILVAKLLKKRVRPEVEKLYRQFTYSPAIQHASDEARRARGRKHLTGAAGTHFHLDLLFARLNRRYFDNTLQPPALSWSQRKTKRILGHHDYTHGAIVISRTLDRADVPTYVVEFVLYHEMLHMKHRPKVVNGRRAYHTAAFRADEEAFEFYEEAMRWIEGMGRRR